MDLLHAIEGLQARASKLEDQTDDLLSKLMHQNRPKKPSNPSQEDLKKDLETSFLQPPTTFDDAWLNTLQQ